MMGNRTEEDKTEEGGNANQERMDEGEQVRLKSKEEKKIIAKVQFETFRTIGQLYHIYKGWEGLLQEKIWAKLPCVLTPWVRRCTRSWRSSPRKFL